LVPTSRMHFFSKLVSIRRDNSETALQCLYQAHVPVLIFSAGFGDLIQGLLRKHGLEYPNIHVIGNSMVFNETDGELLGFKEPLIHTYNKNESVIPPICEYSDAPAQRGNVILLGDSVGDATMAQGVQKPGTLLKIGFLNQVVRAPSRDFNFPSLKF